MEDLNSKMRAIPGIDSLLAAATNQEELAQYNRNLLVEALRSATDKARLELIEGKVERTGSEVILRDAGEILKKLTCPSLRKVINATGIVLHTNLGRAPLSKRAQSRICELISGYSTLEYDVETGERGSRYSHVADRICTLTGAEAAIIVNNNAAAVLIVLAALACGKEVIVSRGQLVEIGGSFRVPDVMRQGGVKLVEVGTTNKTHLYDYEQAINGETAAILKVHTSNYRIVGFTAQPDDKDLVRLAQRCSLPVIEDLGSGTVLAVEAGGWREPTIGERLSSGIDIVTFSGDKLFGGAQAGIIAGKREYVEKVKKHPLLRAMRIDKLSLAAIEGTLMDYALGNPKEDIPVQKMLQASIAELKAKAELLTVQLGSIAKGFEVKTITIKSQAGGGSLPAVDLESYGVGIKSDYISAAGMERKLRHRDVPIIARIQDGGIILDVRCITDDELPEICLAFAEVGEGAAQ